VIGEVISRYRVLEELGAGGMGVVYRAHDEHLDRDVAIKVLRPGALNDDEARRRFRDEARVLSRLSHPGISTIFDFDSRDGLDYLVMELVEGRTLDRVLEAGPLPEAELASTGAQIAEALAAAHEQGVIHSDLKSANVMVSSKGKVKLLDFGLARLCCIATVTGDTVTDAAIGPVAGTIAYMSPEQLLGRELDERADLFSLGIVLYEMVTGQLPFSGSTALDTLHAIAFEETRPVTALRANLPPSLQRIISRCLRKRAQDRYKDARELAGELKSVQREIESGVSSKAPLALQLQERWQALRDRTLGEWLLPALVVLVALAVALSLFFARSHDLGPSAFMMGLAGLFVWRRIRNRRLRLGRRFVRQAAKMPEVRLVTLDGTRFTVLADRAQARTYVRANALLDSVNASMFFGEPFSLVIRDRFTAEEERTLLCGPGVLYLREDAPPSSPLGGA
jgi:eukaryotic-like serine/threonine-protein kinase